MKRCLHLGWKQEDYSTGGGLDSRRLCLLLCFLIFMEFQGYLHSGNEVILVINRGQLIPLGNLKLSCLGLCMSEGVLCIGSLSKVELISERQVQVRYVHMS